MFANKLPINIEDLLHQRRVESERIEYKENWNPEAVLHAICAFANDFHNLGSGYIVIGVREQNGLPEMPPVGLSAAQLDKIQKELLNLGNSAIRPNYHPLTEQYEIQGKHILVLWVVGGENRPYTVGFAAETDNVLAYARDKRARKNLDLIIANDVSRDVFGADDNAATLIAADGETTLPRQAKTTLADSLLTHILSHWKKT